MNKYQFISSTSAVILFTILFNSCYNPVSPDPVDYYISNPPVITGFVRTGESGPEPLGVWGTPNGKGHLPGGEFLITAFPNPTDGSTKLYYGFPEDSHVSIWLIKGRLPGENQSDYSIYSNGYLKTSSQKFSRKLFEGDGSPGTYKVIVDFNDPDLISAPDGFYRVYVEINGEFMWQDILKYSEAGHEGGPFQF